jgi:putative Mn2+ efflux pump MntP
MNLLELFIVAMAVSMDAFAASVCKGLSLYKVNIKSAAIVGLYFGIFQALMPLIGYSLGIQFQHTIVAIDHWLAFILLAAIGLSFIRESKDKECQVPIYTCYEKNIKQYLGFKSMAALAVATSIDALAVGVTFSFLKVNIVPAVSFIGIITFIFSIIGVKLGNTFGLKYKSKAEFVGGLVLILMGVKILFEHIGPI